MASRIWIAILSNYTEFEELLIFTKIVQRVQNDIETTEPFNVKLRFLYVCMNGTNIDGRVESTSGMGGYLAE